MALKRIVLAGVAASAAMLVMVTPVAQAAPVTASEPAQVQATGGDAVEIDPSAIVEMVENLEASDLPRTHTVVEGQPVTTYTLDNGTEITIPDNWNQPVPYVSAGPSLAGPWIELTPLEQQMLVGGGVAGLAAAICTASAGVACPVATAAATAAGFWLSNNGGVCSNNRRLLIEMTWAGGVRGINCR